ncbi:O-antigen ligase family protein [Thiomicrospira pelophila]|uniref:O-antigen ligase family protein n=1 Tax=Thiomicrospira pelophila TaxID=934 RepID=UPI0004A74775|nr:O-antigen ligase family protein [Thiomicrospira pelophila]
MTINSLKPMLSELTKIFIISVSFWSIFLSKLISFEAIFTLLLGLAILVYRRPLREALILPWQWLFVLVSCFIFLALAPMVWFLPLGESSLNLVNARFTALLVFIYIWVMFWQLRPSEDVIWWGIIGGSFAIIFALGYELYLLGDFAKLFTHRFGSAATPHVLRFGIYSNLFLVVLLGGFIWAIKKGSLTTLILIFSIFVALSAVILSNTRSAWAGLIEALIVWAVFYWLHFKQNKPKNTKKTLIMMLFIAASLMTIVTQFGDRFEKRWDAMVVDFNNYLSGSGTGGSVGLRLVMYEVGIKGFLENPLTGVGVDNAEQKQQELSAPIMQRIYGSPRAFSKTHLHNQFIQEAYTRGVLGLLSFVITLGFLLVFFGKNLKHRVKQNSNLNSPWALIGLLFVVSSSISMLTEAWLHLRSGVVFFIFFATFFVFLVQQKNATRLTADS